MSTACESSLIIVLWSDLFGNNSTDNYNTVFHQTKTQLIVRCAVKVWHNARMLQTVICMEEMVKCGRTGSMKCRTNSWQLVNIHHMPGVCQWIISTVMLITYDDTYYYLYFSDEDNWGSERLSNLPEVTQPHISVWVTLPLVPCSHGQVRGDEPEHGICFFQEGARVLVWGPTIKARWIINLCVLKESETHTHTAKGRNLRD